MKDATEFSTREIAEQADDTRARLHMAIDLLYVGKCISGEMADKLKLNIDVLGGAVSVLSSRCLTPEDIIGE